jgi:hypothetical protein
MRCRCGGPPGARAPGNPPVAQGATIVALDAPVHLPLAPLPAPWWNGG